MSQASQTTQLLLTTQELESLQQQQKLLGSTAPIVLSTQHLDPQQQAQLQHQLQQQQQLLQFQQFNLPQPPPPPLQLLQAPPPPPPTSQQDGIIRSVDGQKMETASSPTAVTDVSQITLPNGPINNNNTSVSSHNTTPVREKKKAKRSLKISPNIPNNYENKNVKPPPQARQLKFYQPTPPPPPPLETRRVEGESSNSTSPAKRLPPSDGAEASPCGVQKDDDTTGSGASEPEVSSTTGDLKNEDHCSRASSEEVGQLLFLFDSRLSHLCITDSEWHRNKYINKKN